MNTSLKDKDNKVCSNPNNMFIWTETSNYCISETKIFHKKIILDITLFSRLILKLNSESLLTLKSIFKKRRKKKALFASSLETCIVITVAMEK